MVLISFHFRLDIYSRVLYSPNNGLMVRPDPICFGLPENKMLPISVKTVEKVLQAGSNIS